MSLNYPPIAAAATSAADQDVYATEGPNSMTNLCTLLRSIPNDEYQRRLDRGKLIASQCHNYYSNEIRPAIRFLADVRSGAQKVLVASPMQSGKTNIMACIIVLVRELLPSDNEHHRVRGIYICANNQIDFRRQANESLGHHMEVLTLSDRRRWYDNSDVPLIVFFDESHFGDGETMTISDFLKRHQVFDTRRHLIFCGVSATPFSHMGQLDSDILPDLHLLEEMNYNSVGMMLEKNRILEADPLFVDENGDRLKGRAANDPDQIHLNTQANVYQHIERIMKQAELDGYGIIRCSKTQASMLKNHLDRTYGKRVLVIDWNQHHKELDPKSFFSNRRWGMLTICLVQHKARMGNQIDTRYCHFMYETSPSGNVDTISQSFMGRACGFHKQDHKGIVYSHVAIAEIYDAIMGREPCINRFYGLCAHYKKKPGSRAVLSIRPAGFEIDHIETVSVNRTKNVGQVVRRKILSLQKKHAQLIKNGEGAVRRMSRWLRANKFLVGPSVKSSPGSWAIGVFDREYKNGSWAPNEVIKICLHVRSDRPSRKTERTVTPADNSLFSHLKVSPL